MRNIIDYIKNNQTSLKKSPFNIVDSLIFTNISYLNLNEFMAEGRIYTIKDIIKPENSVALVKDTMYEKENLKFVKALYTSKRFRYLKIGESKYVFNYEKEEQFYAVTIFYDNITYCSFRGTDLSFLGWKENFNMAFSKVVPSQEEARKYVNMIYYKYRSKILLGGHSKGGNLAIYAGLYADKVIKDNIVKIYSFDGPGLYNKVDENKNYLELKEKIVPLTTNKALVGLLMNYMENTFFIKAKGNAVICHDLYTWKLNRNYKFIYVKKNTALTRWFNHAVDDFLVSTTDAQRHEYIDVLFLVFDVNSSVNEIKSTFIKFLGKSRSRYKALTKEQKQTFKKVMRLIRRSFLRILVKKILLIPRLKNKKKYRKNAKKQYLKNMKY